MNLDASIRKITAFTNNYETITENDMTTQLHHISVEYSLTAAYGGQIGSVVKPVDSNGAEVFKASYDAWGKQTITNGTFAFNRGYTIHEHLPEFNQINMNSRMYDPLTAMFFSPAPYLQAPGNWLNYNRYGYCLNNPFLYTDPDGEFWHLIIGAGVGGVVNWAMNGAEFSWKGLGYFGVGAAAGALGAGIGGGISSALPIAGQASGGFAAGFLGTSAATTATSSFVSGALIGGGSGLASGFTTGFGNALINGKNFGQALGQGGIYGAIGMSSGALIGGLDAAIDGRRFWDGATVQKTTLAQQNIPVVGQSGTNDCLPASVEAVDRSFGGGITQQDVRDWAGFEGNAPLGDVDVWSAYGNRSGHLITGEIPSPGVNSPANVLSNMQSGNRVAINLSTGDVGHSVVMQRVVQQTATKINGNVTQKLLYYVMNPANGGSITRISSRSIINAYNVFYILP
jgi:RHS repeat-associated protein